MNQFAPAKAVISIDYIHQEIHEGDHYQCGHLATGVANNGNLDIRFKTGDKYAHLIPFPASSGKSQFACYEAATISVGTALTAYNNNRNSANTSAATITHTPTVTGVGTTVVIPTTLIPGGTGGVTQGNSGSFRNEINLKPNTEYLFRLTNTAGTAQDLNIILTWYEK